MKKFKENKIASILSTIGVSLFLLWFVCLFLMIFNMIFGIGFLLLPIAGIFIGISYTFSKRDEYTKTFLKYIDNKIYNSKNLEDLNSVLNEFETLAIENKLYCLSFPNDIRKRHEKIINQMEILKKL